MVSSQRNIMYLQPCKVIAAGTDRNIMQAGLQRDLASIGVEYEQLKKEVETQFLKLEQANNKGSYNVT
jgi:hypothetical protein